MTQQTLYVVELVQLLVWEVGYDRSDLLRERTVGVHIFWTQPLPLRLWLGLDHVLALSGLRCGLGECGTRQSSFWLRNPLRLHGRALILPVLTDRLLGKLALVKRGKLVEFVGSAIIWVNTLLIRIEVGVAPVLEATPGLVAEPAKRELAPTASLLGRCAHRRLRVAAVTLLAVAVAHHCTPGQPDMRLLTPCSATRCGPGADGTGRAR
mmetsp:Transcript_66070/g.166591  ORF Transcript_66070/g.166591 Transcript_66070/m.166591 type:complete len:209 (-) Transcript_66070:4-630(-)